jgi:hypothetical protein
MSDHIDVTPEVDAICFMANNYDKRGIASFIAKVAAKAKQEGREEVLKELGITLNSRIAKMEILDSKNPSSLRKGIVMAYRDIKEWERQNRTMRKRI